MESKPLLLLLTVFSFSYWIYLIDPFTNNAKKRNYLRLYKDRKYLIFNLILSAAVIGAGGLLNCWPLVFILLALSINRFSNYFFQRDFVLILRGERVNKRYFDLACSMLLLIFPVLALVIIALSYTQR